MPTQFACSKNPSGILISALETMSTDRRSVNLVNEIVSGLGIVTRE